ncbi:MAG: transcriptional regulator [Gemmatimonadetes bacterium]|nr:transcriptional regulator [Gemmatimonadota bacterium]
MGHFFLVTVSGPDRPGIVQQVTEVLVAHGANLEESRMTRLGGEFAAIMRVSLADAPTGALDRGLQGLASGALHVTTRPATSPAPSLEGHVIYEISLAGADHQGIVHAVADILTGEGINIDRLDTDVTNAPETGSPLFSMEAVVQAPSSLSLRGLEEKLADIAQRFGVDLAVRPA